MAKGLGDSCGCRCEVLFEIEIVDERRKVDGSSESQCAAPEPVRWCGGGILNVADSLALSGTGSVLLLPAEDAVSVGAGRVL